jgi:hypothetical protein
MRSKEILGGQAIKSGVGGFNADTHEVTYADRLFLLLLPRVSQVRG